MNYVEGSIVIGAPIAKVYAYLTDISRISDWCVSVVGARWVNQTAQLVGSRADLVVSIAGQPIPSVMVVLEADAPHYFSLRALTGVMGTYTWKLESTSEGTRVTRTIELAVPATSILRQELDALLFAHTQARTIDRDLDRIKAALESQLED